MDEILITARDLELEVNEDDIEELIMGHEDELTTVELQEIFNEEHQETLRNVSASEQEEDERGPMPTSAIKDLLKKWADVRAMVLEWHPNQADVSRTSPEESVGDNGTYHKVAEPPNLVPFPLRKPQRAQIAGIPNATDVSKDSQCPLVIVVSETDGTASTTARARVSLLSDWSLFLLSSCSE
ncbi:uncharacterized protein TNCV_5056231 [Trichonephila clavipes]|nr:uncharacterized protein TNCV_5056231 [Trichonephila clavipes]